MFICLFSMDKGLSVIFKQGFWVVFVSYLYPKISYLGQLCCVLSILWPIFKKSKVFRLDRGLSNKGLPLF